MRLFALVYRTCITSATNRSGNPSLAATELQTLAQIWAYIEVEVATIGSLLNEYALLGARPRFSSFKTVCGRVTSGHCCPCRPQLAAHLIFFCCRINVAIVEWRVLKIATDERRFRGMRSAKVRRQMSGRKGAYARLTKPRARRSMVQPICEGTCSSSFC